MAEIIFYGKFQDIIGPSLELGLPEGVTSLKELVSYLGKLYAGFSEMVLNARTKIVLNDVIVQTDMPISDADRIEFLPPFSGG
ncbi:MoaD/ThiS family protein [Sphingorhabdus sp. Alg239-R122]|uniref:MoaD/ThiS family protein n=1 Tax=Sphingorhabdus sp. Alg239-R122 TaxID=2305989 RepID=UPI0013DAB8FE|nr:MoaD/ThiS family protein [Sphingorhabdus sp. Alg239-R122]